MDVKAIANVQTSVEMNSQNFEIKNNPKNVVKNENERQVRQQEEQQNANKIPNDLIEKAVKNLKKKLSMLNTQLQIQIDKDTEMVVVKVIDKDTKEVIRQIPPEYVLKIAKYLDEIAGLLFNEKA